jgi:hypothetical protein
MEEIDSKRQKEQLVLVKNVSSRNMAVLLLQQFCDRICLRIISVVCVHKHYSRELSFMFCKIRPFVSILYQISLLRETFEMHDLF